MLQLTEAAGAHLAKVLAEVETPEGENVVVRIFREANELSLRFGQTLPGDATFANDGVTVLAIDEQLSRALEKKTLDVEMKENGPNLKLR